MLRVRNGGGTGTCCPRRATSRPVTRSSRHGSGELVVHPAHRRQRARHRAARRRRRRPAAVLGARRRARPPGRSPSSTVSPGPACCGRCAARWPSHCPTCPLPDGVTRPRLPSRPRRAGLARGQRAGLRPPPGAGPLDLDDLLLREAEPWFDPAGFLLAVDIDGHPARLPLDQGAPGAGADPAIGEIYVLGVDPGGHRRGLGAALSVAGLRHLAAAGPAGANLYVDESNTARGGAVPAARFRDLQRRRQLPARLAGKVSSAQAGKVSPAHAGKVSRRGRSAAFGL